MTIPSRDSVRSSCRAHPKYTSSPTDRLLFIST
jgi:hypothetical protein